MKRLLSVFSLVVILISCTTELKHGQTDSENSRFHFVDISKQTDVFDQVAFIDETHVLFTSHYSNSLVKEFYCISDSDTLALYFSEDGRPRLYSTGNEHYVLGDFSNNSALVARLDSEGHVIPFDMECDVDWNEYFKTIASVETKGSSQKENLKKHAQSWLLNNIMEVAFETPSSNVSWLAELVAYLATDDPKYQEYIDNNIDNLNMVSAILSLLIKYNEGTLLIANYHVWKHDYELVKNGLENGMFGTPWAQEYLEFARIIEQGVWLGCPNEIDFPWDGYAGSIPLKMGKANFDLSTLDWGVKSSLPDWIEATPINNGNNSCLSYTIAPNNTMTDRSATIVLYIAGVTNVDYDLACTIHQNRKLQFSTGYVNFQDLNPITIDVISWSNETWSVSHCPSWVNYQVGGLATHKIRSLTLKPLKLIDFSEGEKDNDLIVTVNTRGGGTYDMHLFLYCNDSYSYPCPDSNHPHKIDLGLSVKWSCCNLGASAPGEYGDYYAWGETEPKTEYSWASYKWCNGSYDSFAKYNCWTDYGSVDNKTILDLEDDAAHVKLGGKWRMPTEEEQVELRAQCTWAWTTENGVNGYMVLATNGNRIYLPTAGLRVDDMHLSDVGSWGYYWQSSLWDSGNPISVMALRFYRTNVDFYPYSRSLGFTIRPVSD